ncbi:MAG: MotA/TolQ/ExbB proton channel family protein [Deltaproteobacteria bacterium]|nr:MotA/TolQ/ExbB proton channel family protein [Deltaproteobacteria bacterium]
MWSLIFTGNWLSLAILAVLVAMSILSWAIIVGKMTQIRGIVGENQHFYTLYQREQTIANIYNLSQKMRNSPLARMFEVSYMEIATFRSQLEKAGTLKESRDRLMLNLSRALERIYNQQNLRLEAGLPVLALVSSSSPYIGLFGTVIGIIGAFSNIGTTGVTSLAVVAPGISEALVATAMGLMAAIPALMAYNIFRNRIRDQNVLMKNFALDVTNRLERLL